MLVSKNLQRRPQSGTETVKTMPAGNQGLVISHTHWDREWRYPIWETRLLLIKFMDELIGLLEQGVYHHFLLDGQVAPALDYLEVRPEMRMRLASLVKQGKLHIGPWLTLPDEYPIDGEAMIRNLLLGHRRARELGAVLSVGYTSFGWGQIAQLPQLYAGFGMDVGMVGKRVSTQRAPHCEFLWRAPDGSEMVTSRFGEYGRHNFYLRVHLSALLGIDAETDQWRLNPETAGVLYHRADPAQMEQDHFRLNAPATWRPDYLTAEILQSTWRSACETLLPRRRAMMDGCDYAFAQPHLPDMIQRLNELDQGRNRQWRQASLVEFAELLRRQIPRDQLPVVEGELRDGPALNLTGNALATRLYLKQLNKVAQSLLLRQAEPLGMLAHLQGAELERPLFARAWDFLLKSHAHDSINGVTQDKTAHDVENRLEQVIDLAQTLSNEAMQQLTKRIDCAAFAPTDELLVVFNPLPYPRREVVEAYITMPQEQHFHHLLPPENGVAVYDVHGQAVDTQWHSRQDCTYTVVEPHCWSLPYPCVRHRVLFDTGELPAGGYKVFCTRPLGSDYPLGADWSNSVARTGNLLRNPHVLENEHLRVEMNGNGSFDLTDKQTGWCMRKANYYEDRGELGHYWYNQRPAFDEVHTSRGAAARIWSSLNGPLAASLTSEIRLPLPSAAIPEQQRRSSHVEDLVIRTTVTLHVRQPYAAVRVEFENRHRHHYLRALFPTGINGADSADAGGHFSVDRRAIRPQGPTANSVWPDMATQPMNGFVDISNGRFGVAFLSDHLTEYEVLDDDERTVALSLLRAVKTWIATGQNGSDYPSQDGGHCLRRHRLEYAIYPHRGNWQQAQLPLASLQWQTPLPIVQTRAHAGSLPSGEAALFALDNPHVVFAAMKPAEDRRTTCVRLYNPTDTVQSCEVRFLAELRSAWLTNLDEQRQEMCRLPDNRRVTVELASFKIITLELEFARPT